MYKLSTAYSSAAQNNTRKILTKAVFNGSTILTGKNIIDMSVTEAVNASDGISMGATIASKLEMSIKAPEAPLLLDGGVVDPFVGFEGVYMPADFDIEEGDILTAAGAEVELDGTLVFTVLPEVTQEGILTLGVYDEPEYCPLGKFYISKAESNTDFKSQYKIVAYDGFSKTEQTYSPAIAMPNTAKAILADIATQCGFSLSSEIEYPAGVFDLYDFTCRQYIGYFAGLVGKNARFNRNGRLAFVWYEDHKYTINQNRQYLGGLKRLTDAPFTVQSISSGASDNVLVAGNGVGISFENPFMTQETVDAIFEKTGTFSYTPLQLKWRGNPIVEVGDIVSVESQDGPNYTVYVMEQVLKIGGGLYSEIKCFGQSEADIQFSTSPMQKKMQQVYTKLQQTIKEATGLLKGANGGVFEILDENNDGLNDGWIIHSADGLKFIKANVNGIGITTDGGATFKEALTTMGLNASAITTGQMSAQRVIVGDEVLGNVFSVAQDDNGRIVVTIGAADNDIKQKQTNDAIAFVDKNENQVAKFSVTGAEWQSMQQMKYCGFVWIKSPSSGNVRFTKAEE